jgi:hypothetical protein
MSKRKIDGYTGMMRIERNPIARAGILYYTGAEIGIPGREHELISVYRPPESLDNPEFMESLKGKPIVIGHQFLKVGADGEETNKIDPEGIIQGTVGDIIEFDHSNNILYAPVNLLTQAAFDVIESGEKELSIGAKSVFYPENGTYNGKKYEFIQKFNAVNHVAIVKNGRSGDEVEILDTKPTLEVDKVEIEENEDTDAQARIAELEAENAKLRKKLKKLKGAEESSTPIAEEESDAESEEQEEAEEDGNFERDEKKPESYEAEGHDDNDSQLIDDVMSLDELDKRIDERIANALKQNKEVSDEKEEMTEIAKKHGVEVSDSMNPVEIAQHAIKKLGISKKVAGKNPITALRIFDSLAAVKATETADSSAAKPFPYKDSGKKPKSIMDFSLFGAGGK